MPKKRSYKTKRTSRTTKRRKKTTPKGACLSEALKRSNSLDAYTRTALLVYLDMIESTKIKSMLLDQERSLGNIYEVFHRIMGAVEGCFIKDSTFSIKKYCRVGDALLLAKILSRNETPMALASEIREVVHCFKSLPETIATAAADLRQNLPAFKFRAGIHVGDTFADECDPCSVPSTEIVSIDLDLVTKVANLSEWKKVESGSARRSDSPLRHDHDVLVPAVSWAAFDCLRRQDLGRVIRVIGEMEYARETAKMYACPEKVYSIVDFSRFDEGILAALRDTKGKNIHMVGWLHGRPEAMFGALLRLTLADKLKIRFPRVPLLEGYHKKTGDKYRISLSQGHVLSKQKGLISQPFTSGRGSHHFLVGRLLNGDEAEDYFNLIDDQWLHITVGEDKVKDVLFEAAKGALPLPKRAQASKIKGSDLNDDWLLRLTKLDPAQCRQLKQKLDRFCRSWTDRMAQLIRKLSRSCLGAIAKP